MTMTYVLVEGYYDRSFWAGWLPQFGWRDPGLLKAGRAPVIDAHGQVGQGMFGFARDGHQLRVVPCGGWTEVVPRARKVLKSIATHAVDRIVLTLDADVAIGSPDAATAHVGQRDALAASAGTAQIDLVTWHSARPDAAPSLPPVHTLERIVMEAVLEAHPGHEPAIAEFLNAEPRGPAQNKAHAWAYMAKWYADHGCTEFFQAVWRDTDVARRLHEKLDAIGANAIVKSLGR